MSYRVLQWSTGNVGSYALNGILLHPELDLVGVYAYPQEKQGRNAGELCAFGKSTGITATVNIDELISLKPDCVCYAANNTVNDNYLEETCRLLEAEDGNHTTAGSKATAVRVVNAIPAVCEASPGVKSVLDLPMIIAHGLAGK